jgi:hypothetical protein
MAASRAAMVNVRKFPLQGAKMEKIVCDRAAQRALPFPERPEGMDGETVGLAVHYLLPALTQQVRKRQRPHLLEFKPAISLRLAVFLSDFRCDDAGKFRSHREEQECPKPSHKQKVWFQMQQNCRLTA